MIEDYVTYVEETIGKLRNVSKLVHNGDISPQDVNYALGSYLDVSLMLNSEYQRKKIEYLALEREYDDWYDTKFEESKQEVLSEYSDTKIKPSLKEFETRIRNTNKFEYSTWKNKINRAEAEMRFILRLMDDFSKYDRILTTLSQNMRSEMISLSLDSRANTDPQKASENKVRNSFPKRVPSR